MSTYGETDVTAEETKRNMVKILETLVVRLNKSEFKSLFPDCHRFKFVVDYSCAYHKVNQLVRSS